MPSLGELTVVLGVVNGQFKNDLKDSRSELDLTNLSMRGLVNAAGKLGVAVGAAGAAIITGLVKSGLEAIDTQAKTARAIGGTVNGLRTLQLVTADYGVENAELSSSLERLNKMLGQAQAQGGPAAEIFRRLGLSAKDLAGLDADARVAAIADRVKELGLSTSQTADVLKEFGIRSSAMVDLLRHGGDEIRAAKGDLEDYGLALSQVDARKVEAAGDAIERIGRLWEAVRNALTVALAPIITELADRFTTAAKGAGGFGNVAQMVVEKVIMGFGKVLDVVQGVRVAFKAGEVVLRGFGAVVATVVDLGIQNFKGFAEFIQNTINIIIEGLNKIPGVDIDPVKMSEGFVEFADTVHIAAEDARNAVSTAVDELHNMAMQELPSAKFEKFLDAVKAKATAAAEEMEKVQGSLGGGNEGFVNTDEQGKKEEEATAKYVEQLQARTDALIQSLATEADLEDQRYQDGLAALQEANAALLLTDDDYFLARQLLEEDHFDKLKKIREASMTDLQKFNAMNWKQQTATVIGELANMTAGVAQHSKTMFEINKAAGIANAIVNTAQGITKALASYPPPISFIMAAAQAAAGLAQIAAIKSAQFSGGGAAPAPSLAGSTPAPPTTPVGGTGGGGGNDQIVRIQGLDPTQMFSGRQVVDLLNSAVKDGAKLVIE